MARQGGGARARHAAHVSGRHHPRAPGQNLIVLDASVVVELLLQSAGIAALAERIRADRSLHAPAVLDVEVTHTVRRLCALRHIPEALGHQAISDLQELAMRRYPHTPLLARIWELRENLTPYDAAYVALAESLDAPLVTRDRRLARARGHRARIEFV